MVLDYIRVYQEGTPASTSEIENLTIGVYPNPSVDFISIEVPFQEGGIIEIFTVDGRKIVSQVVTATLNQIDISELPSGAYIVNYQSDSGSGSTQFVKAK